LQASGPDGPQVTGQNEALDVDGKRLTPANSTADTSKKRRKITRAAFMRTLLTKRSPRGPFTLYWCRKDAKR
jgi:hypothetical protein